MQTNTKAFTLVEMIVAMAVSTIIIAATYASYDLVATQYKKNIDVAEMHTSGRAIMQMIERDVRMAGFEYLDNDAKVTYGSITGPLVIKDSGDKCCDEVAVIYDYYDEDSKKVERIKITYSAGPHPRNKGGGDKYDRYRLYKQIDVLGRNNAILANPIIGSKDLLGDFVEDFQIANIIVNSSLYRGSNGANIQIIDPTTKKTVGWIGSGRTTTLAFGPDGLLYQGRNGSNISIFDPKTKKVIPGQAWIGSGRTTTLAFGPDGLLYQGRNGSNISIFDPKTKKTVGWIGSGRTTALAFQNKSTGQESLVTINLTLRTRNPYGINKEFKKKDYFGGNFKFDKNDKYKRDTFSSKVLVRNMAL